MNDLVKLKNLTQNLSVLYVEDSLTIVKQLSSFLEKIFDKVYVAKDGLEGLEKYKKIKPDIVLTDLTMPNMNGFEMIKILKEIEPNVKIIIISAHSDSINLLDAIHLGVSDFVPKPVDRVLLQNALFKASHDITSEFKAISKEDVDSETDLLKKLEIISKNHTSVEFINHYKGIPIIHNGYITKVTNNNIIVHAPIIQVKTISLEKFTVIESDLIDGTVEMKLVEIDSATREVSFTHPKIISSSPKVRKSVRVHPDRNFISILYKKNSKITTQVKDVSIDSISLYLQANDNTFEVDDTIELHMGFATHISASHTSIEHNERISTKATVYKIIEHLNSIEIVLLYSLQKKDDENLGKYIMEKQIEIIKEFKELDLDMK